MKKLTKTEIGMLAIVALTFVLSIVAYPHMPNQVVSHWNAAGQADGTLPKAWGLFLFPTIFALLSALFIAIPRIDPLHSNIDQFRKYYDRFVIVFCLFILGVHAQIILWSSGTHISPNIVFPIGIGILFYVVGDMIQRAKRNWFIGIRTPWTMSSDVVWDKTHALGGKLFKAAGIIGIFGVFFPAYSFAFILVPVVGSSLFCLVYSYVVYKRLA